MREPECPAVCFLIRNLTGGGAEKQVGLLAAGLAEAGVRTSVFWLEDRPQHPRMRALIDAERRAGVRFFPPRAGSRFDIGQVPRLARMLFSAPHGVLWTWGHRADGVALALSVIVPGVRIIGSLRSANAKRIAKNAWLWRLLARRFDGFVSNSHANMELVARVAPQVRRKGVVVNNIVEDSFLGGVRTPRPLRDPLRVAMLGNQSVHTKGYDIAIEVARDLKRCGDRIRICIGGAPSDAAQLRAAIAAYGVEQQIEVCGTIADPRAFFSDSDVFLMLSRFEGTSNALLEAMASGLPCVCTRVGDVGRFARHRQHLLVVDTNAAAACAALRELNANREAAQAMGARAARLVRENFGHEQAIKSALGFVLGCAGAGYAANDGMPGDKSLYGSQLAG